MLPIVEVPRIIAEEMKKYRGVFFREEGFEHIKRYVRGLILSPNKTLTGIKVIFPSYRKLTNHHNN